MNNNSKKNIEYKNLSCPKCKSNSIKKDGKRKTENRGSIQRYKCKKCNHRFVQDNGFFRMRNNPQKITLCLDLFYRGVSTRKIQEHLSAFYPHNSNNSNIYRWIVKYSKKISQFTDNLKLQIGQEIQLDEMEYSRRKYPNKKGVDKNWFIDCIDTKTRFMVSSEFVSGREQKEIKQVLKKAKFKTEEQVKIVTTDGLMAYPNAIQNVYGFSNKTHKVNVIHNQVNASKGEGFNIMIERLHNNIRQRTKTFRGFHGSIESANLIMKGFEVYYNFITKHLALGKCPYELATELKLNSENKWLELIDLSNKQQSPNKSY
jgi:putative transposase